MEIYPEFPVANLNYAGGHTGHQILILVAQATILVNKIDPFLKNYQRDVKSTRKMS
jgi:hypothetical protein